MKIDKNKLYSNSLIISAPGFISIFLSLFAIPIHINTLGMGNFGDYIFFHIALSFSFLLCVGIPKSIIIASGKNLKHKNKIAYEGIKYSLYLLFIIYSIFLINQKYSIIIFEVFELEYLVYGIMISILYLVLEGILQSNKKFFFLSINNFIFYSLSLSLPSIILIYNENLDLNTLIMISVMIKFLVILIVFFILIKQGLINKTKKEILIKTIKKNSLWLTLNSFLVQLYEMLDKYLIKLLFGGASLALYSIPQQITGKLSVLSRGFGTFLMPFLSEGSKKNDYNTTLKIFYCLIPLVIFILFPFYNIILSAWIGETFNEELLNLTKIFSIIAILSSTSHILITRFEAEQLSKINFKLEIYILPIFLVSLALIFTHFNSLIYISLIILAKEFFLNIFRILYLKSKLRNIKLFLFNIFMHTILLILSFFNLNIFLILLIVLIYINFKYVIYN